MIQKFNLKEGNKLTVYALDSQAEVFIASPLEPFISQSAITRGSRPKPIPLANTHYSKLISSPMGNNITVKVCLPRDIASLEEFHLQIDMLYSLAVNSGYFSPSTGSNTHANA